MTVWRMPPALALSVLSVISLRRPLPVEPVEPVEPDPAVLPEPVRKSLVERAAACLGALEPAEIPPTLRRVARFEPRRRARLAAAQIAAALERDEGFRGRVADALRTEQPELAAAVESGDVPAAVDPAEVAVAAYLLRPEGWERVLAGAHATAGREVRDRREAAEASRLREQLDAARSEGAREAARLTERLEEAKAEVRVLRGRVH
ncbi:MAG: hypothetical protein GEU89_21235, partial [Kiloniellaceae bacterium]|nr:hypothetical protein [Kiloniellaceae bacterium]